MSFEQLEPAPSSPPGPPRAAAVFAVAGAAMAVAAALMALLVAAQAAWQLAPPSAVLALGRLRLAYVALTTLGVAALPLAAALVPAWRSAGHGLRSGRAAWALTLWAAGAIVAALAVLGGRGAPAVAGGAPWPALALVLAGAAAWSTVLWAEAARRGAALPAWTSLALAAAVSLVAFGGLGVAVAAAQAQPGAAVLAAAHAHGFTVLGLGTAGMALTAALLPVDAGRPLFGRRALTLGLWTWLPLQALAAGRAAGPDLVPGWLAAASDAAAVLLAIPACALAVLFAGCLLGTPAAVPRDPATRFALAGTSVLLAGTVIDAAVTFGGTEFIAFTSFSPGAALVPPLGALWLFGVAGGYAAAPLAAGRGLPVRPDAHLALALLALALLWVPLWPLGLAQAAEGPSASLLQNGARLALPGTALLVLVAVAWLANQWTALRSGPWPARPRPVGPRDGPPREVVVGVAATTLALVFFVTLFLPSADPAARDPSPLAAVRRAEPGSLQHLGRAVYAREACVACHTQRVRAAPADGRLGPPLGPGDHGEGVALAGRARLGPDLAWIGDRVASREEMEMALEEHRAGGILPHPWLWSGFGPTAEGGALIDYLLGLRSGGEP